MDNCTDTESVDRLFSSETPVVSYIGFDCTAPSLHVGSLVQIMALRWLQKTGHKPIILMGGGTTKVGDPSGKDESRQLLTDDIIQQNMDSLKTVFSRFLTFGEGETDAVMVNNADWLSSINYIDFLRDYGRHFSINRMLTMDSVKLRVEREQHLSFLEFNYMILQAYDFVELNRSHQCQLQIGGSDQWGNIVSGIELSRRLGGEGLFGLTTPLLTTASGAKMGKTAAGAVWLNPDMCSPYDYWQFWRNTEDADVGRFLRLFTELELDEIAALEALQGADINKAKIVLANEITALCHGKEAALQAEETARKTFAEGHSAEGLPTINIEEGRLQEGIPAFLLLKESGLAESGGAAKRLIKGGGGRVNDVPLTDAEQLLTLSDLNQEGVIKLSAGKKKHALVKVG